MRKSVYRRLMREVIDAVKQGKKPPEWPRLSDEERKRNAAYGAMVRATQGPHAARYANAYARSVGRVAP